MEALYQTYKDQGFIVITMLGQNNDATTPTTEELEEWSASYGSSHPLVADDGFGEATFFSNGYLPSMATLGVGAVIIETGNAYDTATIEEYLPNPDQAETEE